MVVSTENEKMACPQCRSHYRTVSTELVTIRNAPVGIEGLAEEVQNSHKKKKHLEVLRGLLQLKSCTLDVGVPFDCWLLLGHSEVHCAGTQ